MHTNIAVFSSLNNTYTHEHMHVCCCVSWTLAAFMYECSLWIQHMYTSFYNSHDIQRCACIYEDILKSENHNNNNNNNGGKKAERKNVLYNEHIELPAESSFIYYIFFMVQLAYLPISNIDIYKCRFRPFSVCLY